MARTKARGSLIDHLVAAIEPALIMMMVGGLTFFLLDLWYEGPFLSRLRWILFWFVFGIVLITRIGMQIGDEPAKGYGVALGGAVALVATNLAGFQPFLLAVMGVVWWAAHKLTYDCTLIDEDQDVGVGLLQESGLETSPEAFETIGPQALETAEPRRPWWKFGGGDPEQGRRPHPPGTWLIYFTIASLPAFGLGQWLVPGVEEDRRVRLFVYVLAYMIGAMGLLLATSFLNLRRYLRRRKIAMPAAMTATWLSTGAVMIAGLTLASAVAIPMLAGVKSVTGGVASTSDRRASRWALLRRDGVRGEGTAGDRDSATKPDDASQESEGSQGSGRGDDPKAPRRGEGEGQPGGKRGPGRSKSGSARGPAASRDGDAGKSGSRRDGPDRQERGESAPPHRDADSSRDGERGRDPQDGESSTPDGGRAAESPSTPPTVPFQAPGWLRVPVQVAGAAFLIYGAFRYGPGLLRGLVAFLAALFGGLWFGGPRKPRTDRDPQPAAAPQPPRPFASFVNPFDAGLDARLSPDDLILYSYEALEAWAYESGRGRSPHETPTEFARRLGAEAPELGPDVVRLVSWFVALAYGRRGFRAEILPHLRVFWRTLEAVAGAETAASPA